MKCWHLQHGLHLDLTIDGYRVSPCCQYNSNKTAVVDKPTEIHQHEILKNLKKDFENNIKNTGCNNCWTHEKLTGNSKRLDAPEQDKWQGIQVWDLRPGNLCNLKCVMCMPHLSTKWYEDVDIWKKYNDPNFDVNRMREKPQLDWDYVKEHTKNQALKIYIAGGEPFYMKEVINFLEFLSEYKFNCENTEIMINTNGISYNDKMVALLKKFKKLILVVSIDGYGKVDEFIRYPTVFLDKMKFIKTCKKFAKVRINVTVSALNLLDLPHLQNRFYRYDVSYNKLHTPDFLSIDSLHPKIIKKAKKVYSGKHKNKIVLDMLSSYNYQPKNSQKLVEYLQDLDKKRNTDSAKIIPWCFRA